MSAANDETWRDDLQAAFDHAAASFSEAQLAGRPPLDFLQTIASAFRGEWATYWVVDASRSVLTSAATWNHPDAPADKLSQDSAARAFVLGEARPGHVWREAKPEWSVDLFRDMALPRSLDAESAGFHEGLWFAVKRDDDVRGVVEILGRRLVPPTPELRLLVEAFGLRLGHSIDG